MIYDCNSPILIAQLFEAVRIINSAKDGKEKLNQNDLNEITNLYETFVYDVLGLKKEDSAGLKETELTSDLIDFILDLRLKAKKNKDFDT